MRFFDTWQAWALLSARFAALTAIFARVGIENINSDFATLIRTIVILLAAAGIVVATGHWQDPATISPRTWTFLILSGLATGFSWLCYFRALKLGEASKVAPIDKLSLASTIVLASLVLGEPLSWRLGVGVALMVAGALLTVAG